MKAVSLWQPWASLIVHGIKGVETRGYPTNVRGRVAIHATKKGGFDEMCLAAHCEPEFEITLVELAKRSGFSSVMTFKQFFEALPKGTLLGTAELYECKPSDRLIEHLSDRELACGNFDEGRFGWLMREPVLFKKPVAWPGKQGWWEADLRLCRTCGQLAEPGIAHCTECQFSALGCL